MKIGILTFHFADNYGAILQAYSLRQYLVDNKAENVTIINYVNKYFQRSCSINPLKKKGIKQIIKAFILFPVKYRQARLFAGFRKDKLKIVGNFLTDLKDESYDCYIVGSDQVWNEKITHGDHTYFLNGVDGENIRRVAYAASSSNSFAEIVSKEGVRTLLDRFDCISVREIHMQKILNGIGIDSKLVLDPVFLQTREFWSQESRKPKAVPERYLLYCPLVPSKNLDILVSKLEEKYSNIPIIVIHPLATRITKCGKLLRNVGPQEFLYLIKNAAAVISNSFHAFAFSCIFSKHIYFEFLPGTSNRLQNLIDLFEIPILPENNTYYTEMNVYGGEKYNAWVGASKEFIEKNILS